MIDCLFVGVNDMRFEDYLKMIKVMGTDSGAYQDIDLAFIEYKGKLFKALDILSYFNDSNKLDVRPLHNLDFLWPTIIYLGTYLHKRWIFF